jgi:hypothetical protein
MSKQTPKNAKRLRTNEMKKLKGGLIDPGGGGMCLTNAQCTYYEAHTGYVTGKCEPNSALKCVCNAGSSSVEWDPCYVWV